MSRNVIFVYISYLFQMGKRIHSVIQHIHYKHLARYLCTHVIVEYRLCKQLPLVGNARNINHVKTELCFLYGPCRDVISMDRVQLSSVRESVNRGLEREAEESLLLEAIARERLVKSQQAGKRLAGAVVSSGAVIAYSSESCI
jgi:hypothetical protein